MGSFGPSMKQTTNSNSGTADAWQSFLGNGLKTGSFGGSPNGPNNPNQSGNNGGAQQTPPNGGGGFGAGIDQMLSGRNPLSGTGSAGPFQGTNFNPLGQVDASQFNSSNFNGGGPDSQALMSLLGGGNKIAGGMAGTQGGPAMDFMNTRNQNFGYNQGSLLNVSGDPQFQAMEALQNRQKSADVANLRARFGASGGGSLGSGAQYAEGNYLAQANPSNMLAQGELQRQMQGIDLQQQGLNANTRLGLLGAQTSDTMGRMGLSNQSQLGNRQISSGESIANAGNQTSANIASAQLNQSGRLGGLNYMLGARGQDANNMFRQQQGNNAAIQTGNENMFQNNQAQNQYGLQNQGMMNQYNMAGTQMGQQNMQDMYRSLFGAYGQSNQLGTAQAQNYVKPGWGSQAAGLIGAVGGLAGGLGGLMGASRGLGGMGGGVGTSQGMMQTPQFNPQSFNPSFGIGGGGGGGMGGANPFGGGGFNPSFGIGGPPSGGMSNPFGGQGYTPNFNMSGVNTNMGGVGGNQMGGMMTMPNGGMPPQSGGMMPPQGQGYGSPQMNPQQLMMMMQQYGGR